MKNRVKQIGVSVLCIAALQSAHATTYNWDKNGSDTLFNNPDNWGGTVPLQGDNSYFNTTGPYTVTFPAGGYIDKSVTEVGTAQVEMSFDTRGSWWLKPANSTWGNPTFRLYGGGHTFNIESVNSAKPQMLMSNALFKVAIHSGVMTNKLESGLLNFYDPDGTKSDNKVVVGHNDSLDQTLILGAGSESRWNTIEFRAKGIRNLIRIEGGTHEVFGTLDIANQNTPGRTGTVYIAGGELITDYYTHVGVNKSQLGQVIIATNGTWTANQNPEIGGTGVGEVILTGGTLNISSGKQLSVGHNNGGKGTVNVISGNLNADTYETLVGNGSTAVGHFNVSGGNVATKYFHVANNVGSTGTVSLTGGTWINSGNGQMGKNGVAEMTVSGGSLTWQDWMMVGAGASAVGQLTLAGGTTQFADIMPGYYGGDGTVDVTGGNHSYSRIRLGQSPCVRSLFHISGGTNTFYGGDGIIVGVQGKAEMVISGGVIDSTSIRIGQNSNKTAEVSSLLIDGGITTIGAINVADNLNNSGLLRLDGGVFAANQIRGWTGAAVKGGNGLALLEADGGTVKARQANSAFITDLDSATLGAGGLAIDTAGFDVTVPQVFSNKSAQTGLLIKGGAGTLSLSGANQHSSTVVAKGTLLALNNSAISGSVVVTNYAVLSLAGSADALTLTELQLGSSEKAGYLALDNSDRITITAADGLLMPFTKITLSSPAADGIYTNFVCAGNVPASIWQSTEIDNPQVSKAYTLGAVYNSSADESYLTITIQDKSSLVVTEKIWEGDEDLNWGTGGNWLGDTSAGGGERAIMPESAAGKVVTITAGATAGELLFNGASSYTLQGANALSLDNQGRLGEINVTAGGHTISADVDIQRTALAVVADGATLDLSGAVDGNGGMVKSGSGQLTLSGSNAFKGATTVDGGRLLISSASAFGGAPAENVNLKLISGTLGYSGGVTTKARGFLVEAEIVTNAVVMDVASDLTLVGVPQVTTGVLIKRGAGVLEMELSGTVNRLSMGNGRALNADLVFPANGDSPSDGFTGFTVAEGVVRLSSAADAVTRIENVANVGAKTTAGTVSPALEIDGGTVYLGGGSMHTYIGSYTPAGSVMTNPALRVTGGATLVVNTIIFGNSSSAVVNPEFLVDDATVNTYWALGIAEQGSGINSIIIRNGGYVFTANNNISIHNRFNLMVDAGKIAVLNPGSQFAFYNNAEGIMTLQNGGRLTVPKVNMESSKGVTLAFDNGVFEPSIDGSLIFNNDDKHTVDLLSGGATFEVNDGITYTVARPLTGVGGLTKTGAGRLIFAETMQYVAGTPTPTGLTAADYAGVTTVAEGTLVLSNATIRSDAVVSVSAGALVDLSDSLVALGTVSGAGVVSNGTISASLAPGSVSGAIDTLTIESLNFTGSSMVCDLVQLEGGPIASNDFVVTTGTISGNGTVDFGRTEIDPLEVPFTVDIMSYDPLVGTPSVAGWKIANPGRSGLGGTFKAEDGTISVTVSYVGGTVIILK